MSYTDYKNLVPVFTGTPVGAVYKQVYPDGFMVYDIAALQSIYGTNPTTNTGNDIYRYDDTPFYHTIYDAGGIDTLDISATTHTNIIRLTPGSYSDINYRSIETQIAEQQAKFHSELGTNYYDNWVADVYNKYKDKIYTGEKALGIAYGVVIENAIGGSGNDVFYDNSVDNYLVGNAGNDTFYEGAAGFDTIDGGPGTDKVVCNLKQVSKLKKKIQVKLW